MKIIAFEQLPYRHLPTDFSKRWQSIVTTPYHEIVDRDRMHEAHVHYLDELMHAARSGFDGVGVTEHSQACYDILPNPNLQLAALAYATETEGLDVALACIGRSLGKTREPLRVAEEYAVIDQISRGRLIAGFPVGLSYDANQNQGVPPIETRARFIENRALVQKAWESREVFPFNGRFSKHPSVNIWPRPWQQPKPPVWMPAVGNPNTLGAILDQDDVFVYLSWFGPKFTGKRIFDRYWDLAAEKGRDRNPYRLAYLQCVAVGETDAAAHRDYGPHIERAFRDGLGSIPLQSMGLPGYVDIRGVEFLAKDPGDFGLMPRMNTIKYEELLEAQCVMVGSPETVRDQLLEMVRSFRIGNLMLMVQFGSMPTELVKQSITLLAERVLPELRSVWESEQWEHRWWPEGARRVPANPRKTANR